MFFKRHKKYFRLIDFPWLRWFAWTSKILLIELAHGQKNLSLIFILSCFENAKCFEWLHCWKNEEFLQELYILFIFWSWRKKAKTCHYIALPWHLRAFHAYFHIFSLFLTAIKVKFLITKKVRSSSLCNQNGSANPMESKKFGKIMIFSSKCNFKARKIWILRLNLVFYSLLCQKPWEPFFNIYLPWMVHSPYKYRLRLATCLFEIKADNRPCFLRQLSEVRD